MRIYLSCFLIVLSACTKSEEIDPWDGIEEGFTPHPLAENMPHNDVSAVEVESLDFIEISNEAPDELRRLHSFLNGNHEEMRSVELSVFVSNLRINAFSLSDNSLIIFDITKNKLLQYSLNNHRFLDLAPEGRGPGDLFFSREMNVDKYRLFIAMQGYRVSIFNCEAEVCEYETTIETPYNNYSISAEGEQIYILGLAPFGREQDPDPGNTDQYAIHQIDESGNIQHSFGPVYNHTAPMVRDVMNSSGSVRYFPKHRLVTVVYSRFPFIFIYDSDGNFLEKYRIPEFKQGYYDHNETTGTGISRGMDHTSIHSAKKIDDDWFLITVRNNIYGEEDRYAHFDYYAFHIPTGQIYLTGRDQTYPFDEARVIHTTKSGLLLNQQGTLYWISQ
jgi:hypothetical protein